MKKILLAVALVMALGIGTKAQDGFIMDWNDATRDGDITMPSVPGQHGLSGDQSAAPLGSGLLILTALGAGYALRKRNA